MKNINTILLFLFITIGIFAQEVKVNTNLVIEADGTIRMDNTATVWEDLRIPFNFGTSNTLATTWQQFVGVTYLDVFKPSGDDALFFSVQLPHSWKAGTNIFPHIHWTPMTEGSEDDNGVYWELEYVWANNAETFPSTTTVISGVTTTPELVGDLVPHRHYITKLGPPEGIDGSGKGISSMLVCRIARRGSNPADTYSGNAGAIEFDFHYQLDTYGSRQEYIK
ncbi:MAG: hypothetical protein FD166_1459 [Bacteroidetes bacterium]|nr:MAG: hypothetical protein FD166_1459 [Bacteroidota bacterium]